MYDDFASPELGVQGEAYFPEGRWRLAGVDVYEVVCGEYEEVGDEGLQEVSHFDKDVPVAMCL